MSVKHIKEYYNTVCDQYHDFLEELRDFETLCNEGLVAPEVIEQAKRTIEPLKDNWQKLNYIIFLLNMPNNKNKQNRYANQNKHLTKDCITDIQVYQQNQKAISDLKNVKSDC